MSKARYYIPKIEEICIGLEVEDNNASVRESKMQEWHKIVIKDIYGMDHCITNLSCKEGDPVRSVTDGRIICYMSSHESTCRRNSIRVKFLDTDDIRAELWTPYAKGNKRHFVLGEFHLYFYPNKEEPENSLVVICDATGVNVNIAENAHKLFHGTIKNRLKLREVMEMTRIEKKDE